jgi:hypothetical protein
MRAAIFVLLAGLGVVAPEAHGQEVQHTPTGTWAMVELKMKDAGPWSSSLELHERSWGFFGAQNVSLIRPALHRDLLPHLEAAFGGTILLSPVTVDKLQTEWNAWEQLTLSGEAGRWQWTTRIRQEQRWIWSDETLPATRANRLRVRISGNHSLSAGDGRWSVAGFVEWWGAQDDAYRTAIFSRSWHAMGIARGFSDGWKVQLTALHQRDATTTGWRISNVGQISLHKTFQGSSE